MPRRLPVRPAKVFGNFFVLIVLSLMAFIYYVNVFINWLPKAQASSKYNYFGSIIISYLLNRH